MRRQSIRSAFFARSTNCAFTDSASERFAAVYSHRSARSRTCEPAWCNTGLRASSTSCLTSLWSSTASSPDDTKIMSSLVATGRGWTTTHRIMNLWLAAWLANSAGTVRTSTKHVRTRPAVAFAHAVCRVPTRSTRYVTSRPRRATADPRLAESSATAADLSSSPLP